MTTANKQFETRVTHLLNGWWDFQPVAHQDLTVPLEPQSVPRTGWQAACYLVPGFFTDHPYPAEWRKARSGWARLKFDVAKSRLKSQRAYLTIKAAIPKAFIFLNGTRVAAQEDMFIGDEYDVTQYLRPGNNELAVFLTEFRTFPHPTSGAVCLIDVPWGCCIASSQAGIWQDVELVWRAPVHIGDVTIRTSTRRNELAVSTRVVNAGSRPYEGRLSHKVVAGASAVVSIPAVKVSLKPGETRDFEQVVAWSDYVPWFPENPHLYMLHSSVSSKGARATDFLGTRFGFRELWIEKHRIIMNGRPQRWYGEWCHKSHSHWLRPEYVRQWYRQLKDLNMNYVRMHTFPHPDYFLDIADEMGIMICQESALHGSGQTGWDTPELWPRAEAHVRRIVRRDKNHPSLVIYSVENEMRWSLNVVPGAKTKLPELRALYNRLDPTRSAYHEGDTSLWNEDEESIISRHYGPAAHGMGWWDKRVPLTSGEVGRWHYASPYTALQWCNDEVFADYRRLSESIARDAGRIVELGRANEVSCLFPWNTSGLDNFRSGEARRFMWDEPNSRYLKPLAHTPYESEYTWWNDSAGYRPGYGFDIVRNAFRPLAVIIREERAQFFNDRPIPHTVYVVNDLPTAVAGTLAVRLEQAQQVVWEKNMPLTVASGETGTVTVSIDLSSIAAPTGSCVITTLFDSPQGSDRHQRPMTVTVRAPDPELSRLGVQVAVIGGGAIAAWLRAQGVTVIDQVDPGALDVNMTPLAVIAEHSVVPGSRQNTDLRSFVMAGGRVLVMEQDCTLFPGISLARMPIEMAFVRDPGHPVMAGITDADLRFFGNDPFGLPSSDAWVTVNPYVKPRENHLVRSIVDSSGGDFGTGGLLWAPVIEVELGKGTIIASQLKIADRMDELPVAQRLAGNILRYLKTFKPRRTVPIRVDAAMGRGMKELREKMPVDVTVRTGRIENDDALEMYSGDKAPAYPAMAMRDLVAGGKTAIVFGLTDAARPYWSRVIGRDIGMFTSGYTVYQLVPGVRNSPLLAGLSNEDACWLENWTYTPVNQKTPIVERLLRVEGAIDHLRNSAHSGLDKLYGVDNPTEWTRMPILSAMIDAPELRTGGGLVEVPVGRGRVIFSQIAWKPGLWQFRRMLGTLLWNLNGMAGTDVAAGETTPVASRQSRGYPVTLRVARCDDDALQAILSLGKRRAESYAVNMPFREWSQWHTVPTPDGRLDAGSIAGAGMVVIGMETICPEPRKFMETLGGWPNPDLQTFLRTQGRGRLRAWINSTAWGSIILSPDSPVYITDIDLEAGSNFVVLAWEPEGVAATLDLCFENKNRRPETTFQFA